MKLNKQNYKKGAMFGLDARIALAIFGALSVISGAALYSAIQDAKVTAFYTGLQEIEKAIIALKLDVGYIPSLGTSQPNASALQVNNVSSDSWNGPYYPLIKSNGGVLENTSNSSSFYSSFVNGAIARIRSINNCSGTSSHNNTDISLDLYVLRADSYAGEHICRSLPLTFLKAVHDKYDSDGDYTSGKIRVYASTDVGFEDFGSIYYQLDSQIFGY